MWAWLTEVPPQYLYTDSWYNGTRFPADYKNTSWRVSQARHAHAHLNKSTTQMQTHAHITDSLCVCVFERETHMHACAHACM